MMANQAHPGFVEPRAYFTWQGRQGLKKNVKVMNTKLDPGNCKGTMKETALNFKISSK